MRSEIFIQHKKKFLTTVAIVTAASAGLVFSLPDAPASAGVLVGATTEPEAVVVSAAAGDSALSAEAEDSETPETPETPVVPVVPVTPVTPVTPVSPVTPPTTPIESVTEPTPAPAVVKPPRRRTAVHRPTSLRKISSGFGSRRAPCWGCSSRHAGVDITPGYGRAVVAVANGVVVRTGRYGRMGVNTAIRHVVNGKVVISVYGHMQRGSLRFGVGQRVKVGQRIGRVGNTGSSTGAHLHFEIRTASGRAINPLTWLRKNLHR